jgi:hypothetical protein
LGGGSTLEQLGQQPLEMGSALGGRAATAGANAGRDLLLGGMGAAATQQQANAYNPFSEALQNLASRPQFGQGVSNYLQNRNPYVANTTASAFGDTTGYSPNAAGYAQPVTLF